MRTRLHGILTDIIESWDEWHAYQYENNWEQFCDNIEELREHLKPKELTDRDVWSELYAKNKVFDELADEIKKEAKWDEGHPPGNDFEGDDNG